MSSFPSTGPAPDAPPAAPDGARPGAAPRVIVGPLPNVAVGERRARAPEGPLPNLRPH